MILEVFFFAEFRVQLFVVLKNFEFIHIIFRPSTYSRYFTMTTAVINSKATRTSAALTGIRFELTNCMK